MIELKKSMFCKVMFHKGETAKETLGHEGIQCIQETERWAVWLESEAEISIR